MGKEQELLQAIREGNIAQVMKIITKVHANKKLSSKKFNINYQDADGITFLHQAALTGNLEVMKLLIEIGCHVDTKDSKGMRPLHYAAWQGRDLPVSVLLNCTSDVNEPSLDGNSPLHLASEHGHSIVVDLLIQHGADISIKNKQHKTALDVACEFGRTKVVEALLLLDPAKGLLKNSEEDTEDNNRTTCLHLAARNGHLDVIMLLIEAGVDINRQTLQGTCLHEASKFGKVEVVRLLLDRGIDATRLNSYEQTALEIVNKFTASKAAKELKQILKEASSDTPGQSAPREIPYFGSPVLGQTHFSTIKRNHSNGSKQPKSPKPAFNPSLNLSTNYSSPLFQSSRTNVTSCLDDDVFCSKGASPSLTSSSSSVTSAFKNQNTLCADHRDSGISSNLSVKAVKPFTQLSNNSMNSRLPQGLLSIQCDSRRCYDPTPFPANHVQGFVNHSHNRVSGGSGGSEGNVSVKSCRSYLPGYLPSNQSNNGIDFQTTIATTTTIANNNNNNNNNNNSNSNNRLSGQSYESGVSTSSRHSFHSNGSSSGGSGAGGEFHPSLEESGFSSLGNFPDLLSQGHTNADIMHGWLSSMKLEELFHLFKEAGYDMPTISRMTPEDLNAIGITKPNVRKKLKFEIGRLNVPDGLPDFIPNTVHDWLELLNLVQYEHALMSQGYKDINSLLQITWEDLEEIGVTKLGHQKKITLAIDRLKRLLSNSSSPASSSDCLSTTTAPLHLSQGQPFPHLPINYHHHHQNIHPGLPISAFNAEGRCVDYNRFAFPDLPRSPLLLNSYGTAFASSNNSLYASIGDTIGRRGSVGSTSGIGATRNWKSTSGESLQRLIELRNLSDFLAADPAAARFDDLNVWQPQVTSAGDQQTLASLREGLVQMQSFNPQLRRDPSLRLSAERTFCSPRQLSLFSNNAFNFGFSHPSKRQSPEVAMNVSGYQPISSGDSTPTNDRRMVPTSTTSFGDSGFFQDTLNNNNNNSSSNNNNNNNSDDNSINSLLNHYMHSSGDDNDDNNNSFQRQKSVEVQDHPLLPPSYLYGTDQSERKASDELRDLTLRTGPYASIPQSSTPDSSNLSTNQVSPSDLVAGSHMIRKDQPPPPPVRSNSFRAESRSLFGLVGDKLHHGGRFEILSNSIAVVTEEDECTDDSERLVGQCGSDSSSGSEDSDMNGTGTLRKTSSTASLSSSDGSVGTLDGNTLPFANENVGTIKQRNNNHSDRSDVKQSTDDTSDTSDSVSNHSDEANNNSRSYENNVPETGRIANVSEMNENSSGQNNSNSDKLFNDIDGMLLGLTQELDEMLKLQP